MPYRYDQRHSLPRRPGIYKLQRRRLFRWVNIYIGLSSNIHRRWNAKGDRRHQHLGRWARGRGKMRLVVSPCWECNLRYWEAAQIKKLRPALNEQRPEPSEHWNILVLVEQAWRGLPWAGLVAFVLWLLHYSGSLAELLHPLAHLRLITLLHGIGGLVCQRFA